MNLTKRLILIAIAAIALTACKKNEADDKPVTSPTENLLTIGSWGLKDFKIDGVNANSEIDACDWDDIYTYLSNHKLTIDMGANQCDTTEPKIINAVWKLSANGTQIMQNGEISDITSISDSKLVLTYDDGFEILTYEYKKK